MATQADLEAIVNKAIDEKVGPWMKQSEARIEKKVLDTLAQWINDSRVIDKQGVNDLLNEAKAEILAAIKSGT